MKKLLTLSAFSGILFTWISVVAGENLNTGTPQIDPASTSLTLFLLGVCLSVISYYGKRHETEK